MKLVCVDCGRLMKIEKNGVVAQENIDLGGHPYRLFSFDKWKCPVCDYEILAGHGNPVYPGTDKYKAWTEDPPDVVFY